MIEVGNLVRQELFKIHSTAVTRVGIVLGKQKTVGVRYMTYNILWQPTAAYPVSKVPYTTNITTEDLEVLS